MYGDRARRQTLSKFNFDLYRDRCIKFYDYPKRLWTSPMKRYIQIVMQRIYDTLFLQGIASFLSKRREFVNGLKDTFPDKKLPFALQRKYGSKRFDLFLLDEFLSEMGLDKTVPLAEIKTRIQNADKAGLVEYDCMVRGDLVYRDLRIIALPFEFTSIGKHVGHFIGYILEHILREIIEHCIATHKRSVPLDMLAFLFPKYGLDENLFMNEDTLAMCLHTAPTSYVPRSEKINEQEIRYNCGKKKRRI